jgi:hypothetical protein
MQHAARRAQQQPLVLLLLLLLLCVQPRARAQAALAPARPEPAVRWLHPAPEGARVLRTDVLVVSVAFEHFELQDGASVCFEIATRDGEPRADQCFTDHVRSAGEFCLERFTAPLLALLSRGEYACTARLVREGSVVARATTRVVVEPPLECPPSRGRQRFLLDAFPVFDELDVLELRFREASGLVDRFLVVEAELTFTGKPKPLYFGDALAAGRFTAWRDRITHVVVSATEMRAAFLARAGSWDAIHPEIHHFEKAQRDRILSAAREAIPADKWDSARVLLSDADEIPRSSALRLLRECDADDGELLPLGLQMRAHHYSFNLVARRGRDLDWGLAGNYHEGPVAVSARQLVERGGPTLLRRLYRCALPDLKVLDNAGWHLTRFGTFESVTDKMAVTASHLISNEGGEAGPGLLDRLRRTGVAVTYHSVGAVGFGLSYYTWTPTAAYHGDLPGGPTTATDQAFAGMFTAEPSQAARDAVAADVLDAHVHAAVHSGTTIQLYAVMGTQETDYPPARPIQVPCADAAAVQVLLCAPEGLQPRLCATLTKAVEGRCSASPHADSVEIRVSISKTGLFLVFVRSQFSSTARIEVALGDDPNEVVDRFCAAHVLSFDDCSLIRNGVFAVASLLPRIFAASKRAHQGALPPASSSAPLSHTGRTELIHFFEPFRPQCRGAPAAACSATGAWGPPSPLSSCAVESAALANAGTARVVVWSNAADASFVASAPLGYSNVEVRRYNSSLLATSGEQRFRRLETLALLGIVQQVGGTALENDLVSLRGLDGLPQNTILSADPGRAQVNLPSVLRFEARHAILGALASAVSAVQNASVWVRVEGDVAGLGASVEDLSAVVALSSSSGDAAKLFEEAPEGATAKELLTGNRWFLKTWESLVFPQVPQMDSSTLLARVMRSQCPLTWASLGSGAAGAASRDELKSARAQQTVLHGERSLGKEPLTAAPHVLHPLQGQQVSSSELEGLELRLRVSPDDLRELEAKDALVCMAISDAGWRCVNRPEAAPGPAEAGLSRVLSVALGMRPAMPVGTTLLRVWFSGIDGQASRVASVALAVDHAEADERAQLELARALAHYGTMARWGTEQAGLRFHKTEA